MTPKWLLDHWHKNKCIKPCSANASNAKASIEEKPGSVRYYCCVGCMMLDLEDDGRREFIESQFNVKGHYSKLANSVNQAERK